MSKPLSTMSALIGILAVVALSQCRAPSPEEPAPPPLQPGTKLSIDELKAQFFRYSAGRRLNPSAWPNGAKAAVTLSFDVDNASYDLAAGNLALESLARGEYGAIDGLPRVLRILDKHDVPASFFIPSVSSILHPQMIQSIMAKERHELGVHGWIHENPALLESEAEENRLMDLTLDYFEETTGKRPLGHRSGGANYSPWTIKILKERGFLYDSTLMASDDLYELLIDGEPTGIVELPFFWILDDAMYFYRTSLRNPELVFGIFRSEFDVAYEEGGMFHLLMHPHVVGHRSRAAELDKLIEYIKSKPDIWFATHEQIVRHVLEDPGLSD